MSDATCRRGERAARRLRSLSDIVADYKERYGDRAAAELHFFASMRNLEVAVTEAGLARMPDGKRWPHQRRIPATIIKEAARRLQRLDLSSVESFEGLRQGIEIAVRRLRGIGELYEYDTALRIGAYLKKMPEGVYLHAGARIGAAALGFDPRARSIELRHFPAGLRELRPYEVEDVLCIYKEWLATTR